MSFKDIKGQDRAIAVLKNAVNSGKVSHAYIFWGPEGIGKRRAALEFAKLLNCRNARDTDPCGECASCKKIDSSNHPDILIFSPEKDGSSIGIDRIRALIKDISLKPYEAGKKVYIVDNADKLTREASNAFLKTLEEPPGDSVLILITHGLKDLIPTIISRAQAVKFFALGIEELKNILIKEYKTDEKLAQILSYVSSGRLGTALKYRDEDFLNKRSGVINGLSDKTFFDSDFAGVSRADLKICLDIMLTWYRDIMVAKVAAGGRAELVNVDKKDVILNEAKRIDFPYLENMINQVMLTASFLDVNANPKLTMSVLGLAALENARQ